jgi:branched-chain amino acid transport system ATP-binding protein
MGFHLAAGKAIKRMAPTASSVSIGSGSGRCGAGLIRRSLGLAPFLVDGIFDIVGRINAETKVAVLLVEQNAAAALEIAHSAYLVENGRIVMNGTAQVLRANPDIDAVYLGGGNRTDYHAVKHYRRRRRWLA